MRKDTPFFSQAANRWWSAPARLRAATLALLRRAAPPRRLPSDEPWLKHPRAGIRA